MTAIQQTSHAEAIQVWQGDSASADAVAKVSAFIDDAASKSPGLLILDSDHSKEHVLAELSGLARLLPQGSLVIVADTVIEDMHSGFYGERGWGPGNSPKSAIDDFLGKNPDFARSSTWGRRGLVTEIRDGVLVRRA
jgi:cephalosporin hydroxylase